MEGRVNIAPNDVELLTRQRIANCALPIESQDKWRHSLRFNWQCAIGNGQYTSANLVSLRLSQNRLDHVASHVGQAVIPPAVPEGKPGVIESKQIQDSRVKIVD